MISEDEKACLLAEVMDVLLKGAVIEGGASPSVIMTALIGNCVIWNARYGQDREILHQLINEMGLCSEEEENQKAAQAGQTALNEMDAIVIDFNNARRTGKLN